MTPLGVVLLRALAPVAPETLWLRLWRVFQASPAYRSRPG